MITLEKLLSELNAGSLNEIIAGTGKCGNGGKGSKGSKKSKMSKKSKRTKGGNGWVCVPPPSTCPPRNQGCK